MGHVHFYLKQQNYVIWLSLATWEAGKCSFSPGLIVIRFLVIRMKWRGADGWAAGRVNALANGTQTRSAAVLKI